ncbi:ABC transporter permease [Leucobacter soli]|uniref:Glutathione transport system permease protein GsiD n=1 Tax=Leucobacter soli TaxID=2812850 RepID=A0A916NHH8_9MICO|nr:ABC transporter permease [Leucobacter soli]CAG7610301.1 Glutathione transport system permease protein GsiD [Leucobacter soli]
MTTVQMALTGSGRRRGTTPILRRALGDVRILIGAILVLLVVLLAFVGPFIAPHDYGTYVAAPFSPPSAETPLGTDVSGYDVLSRVLHGGRTVVIMSVLAAFLGMCIGVPLGLLAAYRRGWFDEILMRATDVMMSFPHIVFTLLIVTIFGHDLWLLVVVVGISHSPQILRVTRAVALEVAEREFVEYAEALGASTWRVVRTQVLPNIVPTLAVEFGLRIVWSVAALASISVLGFGVSAPMADWGLMVNENKSYLAMQPWGAVVPLLLIAAFAIGTNLITDGFSRLIGRKKA